MHIAISICPSGCVRDTRGVLQPCIFCSEQANNRESEGDEEVLRFLICTGLVLGLRAMLADPTVTELGF